MQNLTSEKDGGAARSRAVSSRIRGVVAVVSLQPCLDSWCVSSDRIPFRESAMQCNDIYGWEPTWSHDGFGVFRSASCNAWRRDVDLSLSLLAACKYATSSAGAPLLGNLPRWDDLSSDSSCWPGMSFSCVFASYYSVLFTSIISESSKLVVISYGKSS